MSLNLAVVLFTTLLLQHAVAVALAGDGESAAAPPEVGALRARSDVVPRPRISPPPNIWARFQAARQLRQEGKEKAAFLEFLALPGGAYAAASLGRAAPEEYLGLLHTEQVARGTPQAKLLEADLLLWLGRREEARRGYQALAALVATNGWHTDDPDSYPVEPPVVAANGFVDEPGWPRPAEPFTYGPGSHRDNWRLRRLIALGLMEDAGREFARLWAVHRAATQPWIELAPCIHERGESVGQVPWRVQPHGFDSQGLLFALDYAFFLKKRGDVQSALAVLREPLNLLDLDHNPDARSREALPDRPPGLPVRPANWRRPTWPGNLPVGVSRDEFIRLVFDEYRGAGREKELNTDLERRIAAGDNRARRILARLRRQLGQPEAALAFELEYIRRGGFDEWTQGYRRGLVFEDFQKNAEAIAEFERSLAAPARLQDLPEPDQPDIPNLRTLPKPITPFLASLAADWRTDLRNRLRRLYAATGQTAKGLDLELASFGDERALQDFGALEEARRQFQAASQATRFTEWARARYPEARAPEARANLAWSIQDYATAAEYAAKSATNAITESMWKERFSKLGRDPWRLFLRALLATQPGDSISRLELLDLEDPVEGPQAIDTLEQLLAKDAREAFPWGKGARNRTRFRSYLDLAYRLMRLYEQAGQFGELRALGLRIARGERPFDKYDTSRFPFDENGSEEFGNACLALAIEYADQRPDQDRLAAALSASHWTGARAQLARRTGADSLRPARGGKGASTMPALPWANVPTNVQLFASCESVSSSQPISLATTRSARSPLSVSPWIRPRPTRHWPASGVARPLNSA